MCVCVCVCVCVCERERETQRQRDVLNHCHVALDNRRYNPRNDSILSLISDLARSSLPPSFQLLVDLPDSDYHFPSHICSTDLRPDLVVWSDQQHLLFLVELTVCLECGFDDARHRKDNCYQDLCEDAEGNGFRCLVFPVQVGSRGIVDIKSLSVFFDHFLSIPKEVWKAFLIPYLNQQYDNPTRFGAIGIGWVDYLFIF